MDNQKHIPRVVIVGGGFGGLKAARYLGNAPVQLTVVDRSNHHLFQPLLYQVATATLSPADIAYPIRHILKDQRNTEVLMAEVTGVDTEKREVITAKRNLPYDYLVIATGARHGYFNHPDWEAFAPGLKSIVDATVIRRKILLAFEAAEAELDPQNKIPWMNFVLVGGGPTGVEMAGAIAELAHRALASDFRKIDPKSARVVLIEAGPRILASFPENLSLKAEKALARLGVEVKCNARVENIDEKGVWIAGQCFTTKTIIWAAGVAASPAGQWLHAETDRLGRVKVLPDLSVPNHPEVFVIGDTASVAGPGNTTLPGVAPVAMQEGKYVASVILSKIKGAKDVSPFRYIDKGNLATVGRTFAIAAIGKLRLSGFVAWLAWVVVHIYYLIGFRNRFLVLLEWAFAYLTFHRGARLITDYTEIKAVKNR